MSNLTILKSKGDSSQEDIMRLNKTNKQKITTKMNKGLQSWDRKSNILIKQN